MAGIAAVMAGTGAAARGRGGGRDPGSHDPGTRDGDSRDPGSHDGGSRDRLGRRHGRRGRLLLAAMLLAAPLPTMLLPLAPAVAQDNSGSPAPAGADEPVVVQPDNSLPDTVQTPAFAAFWQRFRAAVKANDRVQLQALTHLPFDFNGKSYGAPDFAALAKQLYDAKTRHCLLSETPLHDQDMYEVFCGETVYVFGTDPELPDYAASNPDGSAWRLIEIGAND